MITALSHTLQRHATGRNVLVFFAAMAVFALVIVPRLQATLETLSGGAGPIDLLLTYTPEQVYALLTSFGDEGRQAYRQFAMTSDLLYPVVYGLFFCLLISWLFRRGLVPGSPWHRLNVLPMGAWVFDWLENIHIVALLSQYPDTLPTVARMASLCTSVKWGFGAVSTAVVLAGVVLAARNGFKAR